jgi:hypothetical protein
MIGKYLEGRSRDLIEVLYWNLPADTEESPKISQGRDSNRTLPEHKPTAVQSVLYLHRQI